MLQGLIGQFSQALQSDWLQSDLSDNVTTKENAAIYFIKNKK